MHIENTHSTQIENTQSRSKILYPDRKYSIYIKNTQKYSIQIENTQSISKILKKPNILHASNTALSSDPDFGQNARGGDE